MAQESATPTHAPRRKWMWLGLASICLWVASALLSFAPAPHRSLAIAKQAPAGCQLALQVATWAQRAEATADTTSLGQAFRRIGYRPPTRSYLLAAQMHQGVGQPAFRYLGIGKAGFASSPGRYWPASTIKLWAAIGALMRLKQHGLTGNAWLQFSDAIGTFSGQPNTLARTMDNVAYDRLMRIASMQQLNHTFRQQLGYKHLVLRRGYGGSGQLSRSPKLPYLHHARRGTLPAQRFQPGALACRKNCTSLFEIQDLLRRIVFHEQIPIAQRLPIALQDVRQLRRSLLRQWKWIKAAAQRQLGKDLKIYNKAGSVPGNHLLDNAVIRSAQGTFLLTLAAPWPRRQTSVAPALRRLNELARQALWQLQQPTRWPLLAQMDAGTPLQVRLTRAQNRRSMQAQLTVSLKAPHQLDKLKAWIGRKPLHLQSKTTRGFVFRRIKLPPQAQVFTLQGYYQGQLIAYRSVAIPAASKRSCP